MSATDIRFTLPMVPLGKGRGRAVLSGGFMRPTVRVVTPTRTRSWEEDFGLQAQQYRPEALLVGPVRVDVLAVLARPAKLPKRWSPVGLCWAPVRPDADNIRKAVLDALSEWWKDDGQVVAGDTLKVYAERGRPPRITVRIRAGAALPLLPELLAGGLGLLEAPPC